MHKKDISNSSQYDLKEENLVSLTLFFDGANYTKSNNDPLHAFFSSICELPPILRNSKKNIITHSIWTGSTPDFNIFLSRFNNQLDNILNSGVFIEVLNQTIRVKCHVFIADAPERALVLNMNQFNGEYSCILCMQKGENVIQNGRGNDFKFTFKPNEMVVRTEEKYSQQVEKSVNENIIVDGIKD